MQHGTGTPITYGNPTLTTMNNLKIVEYYTQLSPRTYEMAPNPGITSSAQRHMTQVMVKITGPSVNEQRKPTLTWQFSGSWSLTGYYHLTITEVTKSIGDQFTLAA